jgi:four helix bundle protein
MAVIRRFEEIEAWKKARELTWEVYAVTSEGAFARDFGLRDQIRRAAVSIMSNIAEGFDRGGNKELIHFLAIAKGSAGEVRSQVYVALDARHIDQSNFDRLSEMAAETSRVISGFMKYLQESPRKGARYD